MLTRASEPFSGRVAVPITEAAFPVPFQGGLEFNPPVHETWNIVHIGMQVPESHQIYICADNCMRGVVLTAAEMGMLDRFSGVILTEKDFNEGKLEEITLEGTTDVINKLPYRPRAVLLFPVCVHHFLGTDMRYVYRELEKRFPDIDFVRCWMDPIMQKQGLSPDQKERVAILANIRGTKKEQHLAADLGSNITLRKDSELALSLRLAGMRVGEIQTCENYETYQQLGDAQVVIARIPSHANAVRRFAQRIGARFLYLPPEVSYQKIDSQEKQLAGVLGINAQEAQNVLDTEHAQQQCEEAWYRLKELVGNARIELDNVALIRPLGFARLLVEHGFRVGCIWLDTIHPEEEEDFLWLRQKTPDLQLGCPINIRMRTQHGQLFGLSKEKVLAVGPKAAWMSGTSYFVNILEQDGGWGFSGLLHLIELMEEAWLEEKDTQTIVPRKGLGCPCIVQ